MKKSAEIQVTVYCLYVYIEYIFTNMFLGTILMNGDIQKLSSGTVVYSTTPEPNVSMGAIPEYVPVNGVTEGAEGLSPVAPSAPRDNGTQQTYPLHQLKQMLSQQLEYYFSR